VASDEKAYRVSVDAVANDRTAAHFVFLARVSVKAANRLLDELLKDIASLEKTPWANPVYDRPYLPPEKYRYKIAGKRYRIVYQIDGSDVFVDDIQDCRQADDKV
jgi:mRNA-degrading endonuclease RelE of RelBE toxin-antitoxin system